MSNASWTTWARGRERIFAVVTRPTRPNDRRFIKSCPRSVLLKCRAAARGVLGDLATRAA
eukprot:CAMPEP_0185706318 /NCGR_PEP_ID=MMETSP1164-20130828/21691_1 /TAXON_ID=1104430 /ORGANISM="Chrysoreinhardia sp, Strain CCMP2950" /LENGTH=59 /DNA_ID=CAMNT_0028373721 /DNA_START=11 /DNA_END=186 /DNA_ORIENTATION=-